MKRLAHPLRGVGALLTCAAVLVPLAGTAGARPAGVPQQPPAALAQQEPKPQLPRLQYETGVDLILVDVTVVDSEGRPVSGLAASDFTVEVGGKPRRIHTAQFVASAAPPAGMKPAAAPGISTNQEPRRGRLFLLVMDEANLTVDDTRALREPLDQFFSTLTSGDRVGLVTVPAGGPRIEFTTDLPRVRRAFDQITGMKTTGLSPALMRYNVGMAEALLLDAHSPDWGAVVRRECAGASDRYTCEIDVEAEARQKVADAMFRATASLGGLQDALRSLRDIEGPKTLVLISGGIVLGRDAGMSISVAQEAAAANASIYVLHVEQPLVDPSVNARWPTLFEDRELARQGLDLVAGRSRGEVFTVPTSAGPALARIASETSGYYLLGVEAEPGDRDGQAHQVHVELAASRRGLTLRSRRVFQMNRTAANASASDESRLSGIMKAPSGVDDVPLSATVYTIGEPAAGRRQVFLAAEIGGQAIAAETVVVGYTIVGADGRERARAGERLSLQPIDAARPSPLRFARIESLEPGEYTLKLGVVLADGRRASVEHPFTMRPTPAGRLQVGDLFVLPAPDEGGADLRADVLPRVATRRVAFYCELYGADADAFEQADITFEIAATPDGPAIAGGKPRVAGSEATRRVVQGALSAAVLSPGDYVARLVVVDRDGVTAQVYRAFRVPERPDR